MLIFGIDKFMSECRALVNFTGNAVATLFIAWWDRALDADRVRRVFNGEPVPALPAELDATSNPLAVESTRLDDEYHPHLHSHHHGEHHAPAPRYRVDDEVRRLGRRGTHPPGTRRGRRGASPRRCSPAAPRTSQGRTMKVLIASDKFKGSLTAAEVAHHLGSGLEQRGITTRALPLADGGDGSVAAAVATGFRSVEVDVAAATGERHTATIAFDGATAVVEVANTCGLHTLPGGTLAPLTSSSAGIGDAVRAAVTLGATRIVLALGGSASTDGGTGMLVGPRGGVPRRGGPSPSPPVAAPCTSSTPWTSAACPT